jgi:o-succinylbenzoate---CoA ligase
MLKMTLLFDGHQVGSGEVALNLNTSRGYEFDVLKFAGEWIDRQVTNFEVQTSGSTGHPKKIMLTRLQLASSAQRTREFFQLNPAGTALLCLDPSFIAGKMMIVRAFEIGMDLICIPPAANPLEDLKIETTIQLAAFVPYQLEAILKSPSSITKLRLVEKVIVGGAKVSDGIIERLQTLPSKFYETYGMTETITHVAVRKLNPLENNFKAMPGISFSADARGCLVISGNDLGSERIVTNDLVELFSATEFQLIGRADNIINTGGAKISPEAIEEKIAKLQLPTLHGTDFFVAGMEDNSLGQRVSLFVETSDAYRIDQQSILTVLKSNLKKWEVPKDIYPCREFVRTRSGKVSRRATVAQVIEANKI